MELLESIKNRRSIKKYLDLEVPTEKIGMIIDAGASAPSSGNIQNWRFVIVKDKESKKRLADAALQQHWMETAPVHIIVCAVIDTAKQFYGMRGEKLYSIQNCAAAIQNMLLMAHSLELGACWVRSFDEEKVRRIIAITENARPQAIITLGIPDEKPPEPSRIPLTHIAFLENYNNKIEDLDATMGYYGANIQKKIEAGKESLGKVASHVEEKSKNFFQRIMEKFKKS